ncbi:helix-turn-helix transcriptional regulator [Aneurinibacillus aneurinilyticus]|jgi:poly-beta-hydroxybutyrate-responsive repressor|uniref:Poly-beta-hydroxybutyrate-responsive repressor n=3 Tax=Bacillales TaxID=1385 RepID=A0A848CRV9_ANEAE|nr:MULTISPECIES: helix-turn-helix transcriptional regulator [Bacillales]ERI10492.1 poly-beta-hydroxybutyrate-responsive repressor [Aneurinibacillus aneurinilyticus ATCC 12856]MCE3023166.1 helix-turn-helix transcriptional regulator [Staphylococcus pasteuri]MCI1693758.1 helix-turn-helix transcriptional regulator [Aneurinibacillus aneurinilyticus]MED0669513.1 helix-turn-helix transcriptional regulator [Aneurinibacillus aneurinilyticus]MED0709081.1 helix-turn-helix transcriptional regulator [Aneur
MGNEKDKTHAYSAPKNLLIPCVLLLLRRMSNYGYRIIQELVEFGFSSIDPGYVYRILRQLESERLVQSHWEVSSGGPPKRMYAITSAGTEYLEAWSQTLEKYQYTLERFFTMYERLLFLSTEKNK